MNKHKSSNVPMGIQYSNEERGALKNRTFICFFMKFSNCSPEDINTEGIFKFCQDSESV